MLMETPRYPTTNMAAYTRNTVPSGVPATVEAHTFFFFNLCRRLFGNIMVTEQQGEVPTPATILTELDATDGFKYFILRIRLRVNPNYLDLGQAAWSSIIESITAAIPAGMGGV